MLTLQNMDIKSGSNSKETRSLLQNNATTEASNM